MTKVLITGGSGLIGRALTRLLVRERIEVAWLSRSAGKENGVTRYKWDPADGFLDPHAFDGVTHLVHLAGSTLIGKRWTKHVKKELFESRVKSAELLFTHLSGQRRLLEAYAGASAVGYYGPAGDDTIFPEDSAPGNDFLARLCVDWEGAHRRMTGVSRRTAMIRAAVVLSPHEGALKLMFPVFKAGLGAPVGTGRQPFPWIHIEDIASIYLKALFDEKMNGPYNAAAAEQVSNRTFTKSLAKALHRPCFLPPVPEAILRLMFGDGSSVITTGQHVSNEKIRNGGFQFRYPGLSGALDDLVR